MDRTEEPLPRPWGQCKQDRAAMGLSAQVNIVGLCPITALLANKAQGQPAFIFRRRGTTNPNPNLRT